MNCHRARQLISPYLDHQLTGQQMLALQQHCAACASCEAEMRSLRQLKSLLRGLHEPRSRADLPEAIANRLTEADAPLSLGMVFLPTTSLLTRPQRGRRLVTAMALSCLAVLAVAAPFAPDGAIASAMLFRPHADLPAQPAMLQLTAMPAADVRPSELLILTDTDESRRERMFAAPYAQPPQLDSMAAPLADEAVPAYVQGDVAFAGYRTR